MSVDLDFLDNLDKEKFTLKLSPHWKELKQYLSNIPYHERRRVSLKWAVVNGYLDIVKHLYETNINFYLYKNYGNLIIDAFESAVNNKHFEIAKYLITYNDDIISKLNIVTTVEVMIYESVEINTFDIFIFLLDLFEFKSSRGDIYEWIIKYGRLEMLKYMHGIYFAITNHLHYACLYDQLEIVKYLMKKGYFTNISNEYKISSRKIRLHYANFNLTDLYRFPSYKYLALRMDAVKLAAFVNGRSQNKYLKMEILERKWSDPKPNVLFGFVI